MIARSEAGAKFDRVLMGGRVLDERNNIDAVLDVAIRQGVIAAVGSGLASQAREVSDVSGQIVVPGLIDIHAHVYDKATSLGVDPDFVARRSGTTTLVDAGSAGAGNYDGLRDFIMKRSAYRVLAFLNVSFPGIFGFDIGLTIGEATSRSLLPVDRCVAKINANRDRIVGVKVRIGGPVTGDFGLGALDLALEAADAVGLPLMAHVGGPPPSYQDIVARLRPGDILTHCFRPEPNSLRAPETDAVLAGVESARARGVLFDIGHGMGAFSFETTDAALAAGFKPDLISSDVHVASVNGPAYDLAHTMSKLLGCGLSLPAVVGMSSNRPALAIRRPELGHLGVGAPADITVLKLCESDFPFRDVTGLERRGRTLLQPSAVFVAGCEMEIGARPFEAPFIVGCGCESKTRFTCN